MAPWPTRVNSFDAGVRNVAAQTLARRDFVSGRFWRTPRARVGGRSWIPDDKPGVSASVLR